PPLSASRRRPELITRISFRLPLACRPVRHTPAFGERSRVAVEFGDVFCPLLVIAFRPARPTRRKLRDLVEQVADLLIVGEVSPNVLGARVELAAAFRWYPFCTFLACVLLASCALLLEPLPVGKRWHPQRAFRVLCPVQPHGPLDERLRHRGMPAGGGFLERAPLVRPGGRVHHLAHRGAGVRVRARPVGVVLPEIAADQEVVELALEPFVDTGGSAVAAPRAGFA